MENEHILKTTLKKVGMIEFFSPNKTLVVRGMYLTLGWAGLSFCNAPWYKNELVSPLTTSVFQSII